MKKLMMFFVVGLLLVSCNTDDDICTSGEATPRAKIKFKDANNKLVELDSIYVDVDYGDGMENIIAAAAVDSVLVPLRVDESLYTKIDIRTSSEETASTITIDYTTTNKYVSPACGVKKLYHDVTYTLENMDAVTDVESNQTQIIDENKTHFYLIF